MKGPKKGGHKESIEGRELIGDRQVEFTRHFDERGETFTQYGSGPSYLCRFARDGRWSMSFDYSETVTERQLSRRTTRRRGARAEWENYLLESAVEFLHVKLANDPARRVAGDPSPWRRVVRHMVIKALRGLDTAPLEQLAAAIEAVRWVQSRPVENELVMFAILAAARAHQRVPYRSEVLELLGADVAISREKNAWHVRLASIGFNWLPGGLPRKPKVRVAKIHARGFK